MTFRGRHWIMLWLLLFLGVAAIVLARRTAALETARRLNVLREERTGLEAERAALQRDLRLTLGRQELGKGRRIEEIAAELTEVAEGINTARAVKNLADRAGLEMPIVNEVNAVLYEGRSARDAVTELMSRPLREEVS